MENEYNIPMNDEWGEEVREMCNLSQGIEEKGIRKGLKQGIEQGITQQKQNTISFIKEMQKKRLVSGRNPCFSYKHRNRISVQPKRDCSCSSLFLTRSSKISSII